MNLDSQVWISLLRGINVGGHNKLPMAELRELFTAAGCSKVLTYIQSGNIVFREAETRRKELAVRLANEIKSAKGFRPTIMLLTHDELEIAANANPFPKAVSEPKTLHLWFMNHAPEDPDLDTLDNLRAPTERFELRGPVFYLSAPDGIGHSKLANRVEHALGVEATARNWRTVERLRDLASEVAATQ